MATSTTSCVYIQVIEDVMNKVREEFINNGGPGESVLNELQGIWEMKMMQAGAILGKIDRSSAPNPTPGGPITPVHDLNVPYEGTEEYETPTADLLFPPTPLQTPGQTPLPGTGQTPLPGTAQTPLPGTANSSMYSIPTGGTPISPNDHSSINETTAASEIKNGRPSQYMQPASTWTNQRHPLDVNVAYMEGRDERNRGTSHQPTTQDFFMMSSGKRKREDFSSQYQPSGYIPQQDGAGDSFSFKLEFGGVNNTKSVSVDNQEMTAQGVRWSSKIPQLDGQTSDPYDEMLSTPNIYNYQGVVNEDYNIAAPAPNDLQAATPAVVVQNETVDDDDEEPLNENDDEDDLDDVDQGDEQDRTHLVLAQFDKVTRTKSRWKCTLKDGVMHINNKDILFNKANGEFDF